jgi:cytochrome c oxidase subunit 3
MEPTKDTLRPSREKAKNTVLWLFLVSVSLLFSAFTSAYLVRRDGSNWLDFDVPESFFTSTLVLLSSSITLFGAHLFIRKGAAMVSGFFVFITFILGLWFMGLQWNGWGELVKQGIFFVDNRTGNVSGSFFYVLTAVHLVHLISGLMALFFVTIKMFFKKYTVENHYGFTRAAIYWHFLDLLWLYLYLFLVFT